jgi:potassium voltage-gated channel Eag-related subfamily H protein 8
MTTLASVGYGDLRPISNSERLITALIFLVGVAAFSFIMGNFIDMLMEFKTVTAENEDHSGLSKFFSLLARFNSGHPLPKDMRRRLEKYFEYFWARDLNYAMKSEADQRFISELPKEIKISVSDSSPYYSSFHRFIRNFCSTSSSTSSEPTSKL